MPAPIQQLRASPSLRGVSRHTFGQFAPEERGVRTAGDGEAHPVLRSDCVALAGKSTALNRREHTPKRHAAKYRRIDCDGPQVDALLVEAFPGGA